MLMKNLNKRTLSAQELDLLAKELDAVRARAMADVGKKRCKLYTTCRRTSAL